MRFWKGNGDKEEDEKPKYLFLGRNKKKVPKENIKKSRRGVKKQRRSNWEEVDDLDVIAPLPNKEEMDANVESLDDMLNNSGFWDVH